ncbi:MAG: retropepsin-like aspartic protease family protein, partial [Nannocystaceae bacterium]
MTQRPPRIAPGRRSPRRVFIDAVGWAMLTSLALLGVGIGFVFLYMLNGSEANLLPRWVIPFTLSALVPAALAIWKHPKTPSRALPSALNLFPLLNAMAIVVAIILVPESVGSALRRLGLEAIERFGSNDRNAQVISAWGMNLADRVDPPTTPVEVTSPPPTPTDSTDVERLDSNARVDVTPSPPPPAAPPSPASSKREGIYVQFDPNGTGITIPATLRGPGGEKTVDYLFDTGATFTTITRAMADKLGVRVRPDAPTQSFNTAKGPAQTPMVYLDALTLGDVTIHGVLVAV